MRVTSINNNNYQKQQSFGAIPGKNFSKGLTEFMTEAFGSEASLELHLQRSESLGNFILKFRDIKLASTRGKIDPVIDISRIDNEHFRISASLSGIEGKETGIWLNSKQIPADSTPLDEILKWANIITSEFQERYMPLIGTNKSGRSIQERVDLLTERIYQYQK